MRRTLKFVLIGSLLAGLVACQRNGDKPAQERNPTTPSPATDASQADGAAAPTGTTSGAAATGAATGSDAAQGTTPPADPQ
ncbi:hypothetical protein [Xanthomonas theicola]|uniref:Lipoprotein n=1 Tax=Xanthomonas theicola TaxID=56464 RepID=A0A2S6ZC34_9XANT|nr:hypothetical protein [Xanthomonas theicola]PPT86774.1 hypothetical protein XthCFBP4691_15905 [Xanthomonas theicola]QNH24943.1 hypothetical protein G4Q83_09570 [Xanthomonas theicola]